MSEGQQTMSAPVVVLVLAASVSAPVPASVSAPIPAAPPPYSSIVITQG